MKLFNFLIGIFLLFALFTDVIESYGSVLNNTVVRTMSLADKQLKDEDRSQKIGELDKLYDNKSE